MIRHIVMFEFMKEFEGRSATQNAVIIKNQLLTLKEKLDYIRHMEVGINDAEADSSNYMLCLTCDFDSIEDLNRYAVDPEHLRVSALIAKVKLSRACIDYNIT